MMIANQHTVRIVILLIIIGSTLAAFPRKNTTKLQHTYVDYLNQNWCKNTPKYQAVQAPTVRKERMFSNSIQVDIDQIAKGNLLHSVTFNSSFFISLFLHGGCFIYFWLTLRRLSVYNNKAIKSSIKLSEPLAIKHNNKKYLIFKGLILALLLCNAYYSIIGLNISAEIEKGLGQLLCGLVNIPDNFARVGGQQPAIPNNQASFNDYQYQTMVLRELFKEAHSSLTHVQQLHKQNKFITQITRTSSNISGEQAKGFISHLTKALQSMPSLINQTKFMEVSLIYFRGALYWIKGGNIFANNLLNSYCSLNRMPKLISSVVGQTYQILLLCFLGVFCAIVFMSFRNTSKQGVIVKYIILGLSFSTLLCLGFSSLGAYLLPVPKQVCNVLTKYDSKAVLVDKVTSNMLLAQVIKPTLIQLMERMSQQSDGNMAFIDPEVYQNMHNQQQQLKALLAYNDLKDIQAEIISQFPDIEQETHAYFANYTNVSNQLKETSLIFDKIASSVSKEGNFGRLTIRPLGEHFQALQHNLCNVNISIWSKNTDNLLSCAIISLMIMICLALYLRSKLKGDYQWANAEDDHFELTSINQ